MIPASVIEDLKFRNNIEDVIGASVPSTVRRRPLLLYTQGREDISTALDVALAEM